MTHAVIFAATARRDLRRIPPRIVPAIIEFVFGDLARTLRRVDKPLKGDLEGSYSARRGPYRILCNINDAANRVEILRVDHRADGPSVMARFTVQVRLISTSTPRRRSLRWSVWPVPRSWAPPDKNARRDDFDE